MSLALVVKLEMQSKTILRNACCLVTKLCPIPL